MAKSNIGVGRRFRRIRIALAAVFTAALATASGLANAADWRVVIASADLVVMVDAGTFRREGQQLAFRSTAYQPKPDADGSIGNLSNLTFDCAGRRMKAEQTLDIRPDGNTVPTKDEQAGFVAIPPGNMAEVFLDRMCGIKPNGNRMDGVMVGVLPATAARSIFGLLKLGLNSAQASNLATFNYEDDESLLKRLNAAAVPSAKQNQARKVLAGQTVQPPPPIVPLKSAVATGKVGKYTYSAHEIVAGLWLRADGTFRYGLTVGSLDETAAGRWTATGNRVQLFNEPRPVPPAVTAGPGKLEPSGPWSFTLLTQAGRAVAGMDVLVEFDVGDPLESYTQQGRWTLPAAEQRQPRFITFSWAAYGLQPARFAVDVKTANASTFVFTPNDFGVADLTGLVVDAEQDGLTLHRSGGTMRFSKRNP